MLKRKYVEETSSEDDINVYSSDAREALLEADELTPMEEAFMAGYENAG